MLAVRNLRLDGSVEKGAAQLNAYTGFPSASDSRELACSAGDLGLIPRSGRSPGEGNGNPLQIPWNLPGNLVGYSPWDHKESGMIE